MKNLKDFFIAIVYIIIVYLGSYYSFILICSAVMLENYFTNPTITHLLIGNTIAVTLTFAYINEEYK